MLNKNKELLEQIKEALKSAEKIQADSKTQNHTDVELLVRARDHVALRIKFLEEQTPKKEEAK